MKKVFEGATAVSVFLFLLSSAIALVFNVHKQTSRDKAIRKEQKKAEKKALDKDRAYRSFLEDKEKDISQLKEDKETLQKLNDPLWNYYNLMEERFVPLPGDYSKDCPPTRP